MLLTIDIGNTNLTFGVFEGEKLRSTFRLTTNIPRTSNEFGDAIVEGLSRQHISEATIDDVIIASVVPKVMYSLVSGIKKYFHCTPYVVGEDLVEGFLRDGYRRRFVFYYHTRLQIPGIQHTVAAQLLAADGQLHLVGKEGSGVALVVGKEMDEMLAHPFFGSQRYEFPAQYVEDILSAILLARFYFVRR